ncbi:MAG: hypothetical protein GX601_07670 [Anaerolineales bacterium]|nr:hypothetical protein [Anaerolineales bacterium]
MSARVLPDSDACATIRATMDAATNRPLRKLLTLLAWCLLLAVAWALWSWRLDASDLTFDETATYFVAHRPALEILRYLQGAVREHPPVYYLLIHAWMRVAGTSEFSLRLFSVGAGLVGLALTGWLARLVANRHPGHPCSGLVAGLVASVLLLAMPGMAFYARDARMYSLALVWTVLSSGLFVRDWLSAREWPSRTACLALGLVHVLALFTHYYLLLPMVVQPLVLLLARRWKPLVAWCGLHGVPALVGLVWLLAAPGLRMTATSVSNNLFAAIPTLFQTERLLAKLLFSPVVQVQYRLFEGVLLLVALGLALAVWRSRWAGGWLALSLVVSTDLALLVPHTPAPRYIVFLMPLMAVALSYVCALPLNLKALGTRWLSASLSLVLTAVVSWGLAAGGLAESLVFVQSRYGRTLQTVRANARPGDQVLFYGPWQWIQFQYYDPGDMPPTTTLPLRAPPRLDPEEARPVLRDLLQHSERIWMLPASVDDVDPSRFVEGWLNRNAHKVWATQDFSLYVPPAPDQMQACDAGLVFGERLLLEQVAHQALPIAAGEPLRLTLHWRPLRQLEGDVRITLTLVDQDGRVWNVARAIPLEWRASPATWQEEQTVPDREGIVIPQGAPPGSYTLLISVNDARTSEVLSVGGAAQAELLQVEVAAPVEAPVLHDLPNPQATTWCATEAAHCLDLVGYEPGGVRFQQGHAVPFTVHLLLPQALEEGTTLRMRLVRQPRWPWLDDNEVAARLLPLPAAEQQQERLLTVLSELAIPSDAPTGRTTLELEVLSSDGTPWQTETGGSTVRLFDITVEGRPVLRELPQDFTPIEVDFGDEVGLRGYRVQGDIRPGGTVEVTYVWYARVRPTAVYAIFNHLTTADGSPVQQADGWPQEGRMLTIQWQPGEYIEDTHRVEIPADAPPGPYVLYVGLYDAANNERKPAFQGGQPLPGDQLALDVSAEQAR